MAKNIHLTYNLLLSKYIFTESANPADFNRRKEWSPEKKSLLSKLGSHIDSKRKSVLHLYDVPEEVKAEIFEAYDGTKVTVEVARDRKFN